MQFNPLIADQTTKTRPKGSWIEHLGEYRSVVAGWRVDVDLPDQDSDPVVTRDAIAAGHVFEPAHLSPSSWASRLSYHSTAIAGHRQGEPR